MKRLLSIIILSVFATFALIVSLVGCTDASSSLKEVVKPASMDVSQAEVQWLYAKQPGAPTLIYFEDSSNVYQTTTLKFPDGLRPVADTSFTIKDNMWEYWRENGYNVGVFRVEGFAVADNATYYAKLLNAELTTYVNADGTPGEGTLNCSLVQAFCAKYVAALADDVAKYDKAETTFDASMPDVRFAGSGVGALFATYAAEELYRLYASDEISEYCLPNRVALLNPYLTEKRVLERAAESIEYLATEGVALEYVESDNYATASYISSERDLYNRIIAQCAGLSMRDTYSASLRVEVKEKIALTWYLASVNGSDFFKLGTQPDTNYGRNPIYNNPELYYNTYNNYGVSAWTPTPYTRLLRGNMFTQCKYDFQTNKATDYYSSTFRIELYQFDKAGSFSVGGYVFNDQNGDNMLNDGIYSSALKNISVTISYKDGNGDEVTFGTVETDNTGFYKMTLNKEQYNVENRELYVKVSKPNYRYLYSTLTTAHTDDVDMYYSLIGESGTLIGSYYSEYDRYSQTNRLLNCGFKKS